MGDIFSFSCKTGALEFGCKNINVRQAWIHPGIFLECRRKKAIEQVKGFLTEESKTDFCFCLIFLPDILLKTKYIYAD